MKKALIVLAALFCGICANAQWYVGGSIYHYTNVHSYEGTSTTTNNFGIAPEAGYKLNDKWSVGASLDLSSNFNDHLGISIAPYVRWTFFNMDFFHIFLDGVLSYTHDSYSDGVKFNGWGISVNPGFAFDLTSKWSLAMRVAGIGFGQNYGPHSPANNDFNISINGATIGCYYSF